MSSSGAKSDGSRGPTGPLTASATRQAPGRFPASVRGRVLLHSGIQLTGKAASALGALALLWLLTRYLGPSGFGRYTFVAGYVSLFYVVSDLGSQAIAVRDMARHPEQAAIIAGRLLTLKTVIALFAFVAAVAIAWSLPIASFRASGVEVAVLLGSMSLLTVPPLASSGAIFQTSLRMQVPAIADALGRLLTLALVAMIVLNFFVPATANLSAKLAAVFAAGTAGAFLGAVVSVVGARQIVNLRPRFDVSLSSPLVRDAIPLGIVFILGVIHYRIDVFILSVMRGMNVVGLYGVGVKLLDVALAGSAVFMGLAFPVLSERSTGDQELLKRAFQKTLDFMLVVGIGAAIFASLLAPYLVAVFAGGHFRGAALPTAIIAWAIPITFANTVFAHMVVAANRQNRAVPLSLATISVNILLNVLLIPHLGASAPALVTVITEGLGVVGMGIIMAKHYGFGPSSASLARILTSGGLAVICFLLIQGSNLPIAVAATGLVYVSALVLSRAVTPDDIRATLARQA